MAVWAYIHQFDQLGEQTVPAIAATLRSGGIAEVRVKSHQGTTFIGHFDQSPLALTSLAAIAARRDAFAAQGITMRCWSVPDGGIGPAEAAFTAQVAALFGNQIELDLEPYAGFWSAPFSNLAAYTDALIAAGARYVADFDVRAGGWMPFGFDQFSHVLARADAVVTQSYWTDFGEDAVDVVNQAIATLAVFGVPLAKVGIILPGNGWPDFGRAVAAAQAQGINNVGLWRMGTAPAQAYQALAAIAPAGGVRIDAIDTSALAAVVGTGLVLGGGYALLNAMGVIH